jgi:putative DNA methylase
MPTHGHLLFTPINGYTVSSIMHSLKSFTASAANKRLNRNGRFWSPDYFDRYIRDREHFASAKKYIEVNPVKAGLCAKKEMWRWGSAWGGYEDIPQR